MENVRFIFCDPKEDLSKCWVDEINKQLSREERSRFTIIHGVLDDVKTSFDCIVSPANSYARLDGAFDLVISKMFAPDDPDRVTDHCQEYLYAIYNGYQPTGTSLLIPMHNIGNNRYKCKYILHCPTMRIPSNCTWNKEVVYNCMWSLLCEVRRHNSTVKGNKIRDILVTGLGTGIGRFPSETCAKQMICAYKHFLRNLKKQEKNTSWKEIHDTSLDIEETWRTRTFLSK